MAAKYPRSKRLFEKASSVIPSGVTSPVRYFEPHPFFVKSAAGCHMHDADGRKITDMCCGYGALLLGHRRKEIIDAVSSQLGRGTLYCAPTEEETDLASMIIRNYPSAQYVRLVNTGGEATMSAIRIARGHTGRDKILKFDGCYHGAHDAVLVGAGSGAAHYGVPASAGVPKESSKNTLVSEYNNEEMAEQIITENADTLACVIIEPIMANMGLVLPEPGFLKKLRKLTRQNNIVLVFDEVVTGFRMSAGGAQKYYGITPDITTLAKAMSNGFGAAAVCGKKEIMQEMAPKGSTYQASTFAGNPVATSAAIASIKAMNRLGDSMYTRLERRGAQIAGAIDDMASEYDIPHVTSHAGSMIQIFFTEQEQIRNGADALRCDRTRFKAMADAMLECGVFVAQSQFEVAFLSNAHTKDDISRVIDAYDRGLAAVAAKIGSGVGTSGK